MQHIDLHVHTTASDGTLTPAQAVRHARELGLSAIAVTDHDTHFGVAEAMAVGADYGLEVVPGIEVSVDWHGYGIHVLGYFIDPDAAALQTLLDLVIAERKRRNRLIAAEMHADGLPICIEELRDKYPESVIGRPHFAAALVEHGLAESVADAFDRYLGIGQKYFRKREYIPLQKGLEIIRDAGGKAVFAHPLQYCLDEAGLLSLTQTLCDAGAVGMECIYSGYAPEQTAYLQGLAKDFGLCVTGGSDFHGARKPIEMGTPEVPYDLLETLKNVK